MKLWHWLIAGLGVLGAVVIALANYVAGKLTTRPRPARPVEYAITPYELDIPYEMVYFPNKDGLKLTGWLLDQPGAQQVVIGSSGFNGSKEDLIGIGSWLWRKGFAVFLFDYRGQGQSEAAVSTIGHNEVDDFTAALDYVSARYPQAKIGAVGFSMGGSTTILAAARDQRVRAVVADSPFADLKVTVGQLFRATTHLPSRPVLDVAEWLIQRRAGYRISAVAPLRVVADISPRPLLIIGGTADDTAYFSEQQKLYAAAGQPTELWRLEGVGHCGAYFVDRRYYVEKVAGFFSEAKQRAVLLGQKLDYLMQTCYHKPRRVAAWSATILWQGSQLSSHCNLPALSVRGRNWGKVLIKSRRIVLAAVALLLTVSIVSPAYADSPIKVGGIAVVANTDGSQARVRSGPATTTDINTELNEGTAVEVYDGPRKDSNGNTWYKVRNAQGSGWMSAAYLAAKGSQPTTSTQQAANSSSAAKIKIGTNVQVSGDGVLRLRERPSTSGEVLAELDPGYVLTVVGASKLDSAGRSWTQVKGRLTTGWVASDYLTVASPKAVTAFRSGTARGTTASSVNSVSAAPASVSARIVANGLRYVGYRYVWGASSPARGFDCSGFTYYVMNKSGINIGRDMYSQLYSGKRVGLYSLQAGDLVFLRNTYKRGLSHAAIYIGGGKIVHAGTERSGVTVSNLYTSFYISHFYTGVRPSR